MRKLIAILSLGTSALAVTSIYLWTELQDARAQVAALNQPSQATPGGARSQQREGSAKSTATSQPALRAAEAISPKDDAKARQKMVEEEYRDGARRKLAQLSDPAMRAQMLEEWKEANLAIQSQYARYVGLSEAEVERLIDLLGEHYLAQSEAHARCALMPACNHHVLFRENNAAEQRAIADLLGTDKQERFEQYKYTNVERQLVSQFLRHKIPAGSQLSDEQAEQLVAALADERRLAETEIEQRGFEPSGFPMEGVAFTFQNNMFESGNTAERLNEAADYNRRIHARAKPILTAPQLAAFEQMQSAAMAGLKSVLRQQERDRSTRVAIPEESR